MENYEEINRSDSVLSNYNNYKIDYKRRRLPGNSLSVILTQLIIAAILMLTILLLKFVSVFEPIFEAIKDFMQKDIFEGFGNLVKSVFNIGT